MKIKPRKVNFPPFSILFVATLVSSCASGPNNTVGAAYDADSNYCRKLTLNSHQPTNVSNNTPASPNQPPPSNSQLYEQLCEPVGPWQARDIEGHDSTVAYENSLFSKVRKFFR
jgi:hypothetical protein